MNTVSKQLLQYQKNYIKLFFNVTRILQSHLPIFTSNFTSSAEYIDAFTIEPAPRHRTKSLNNLGFNETGIRYFMGLGSTTKIDIKQLTADELDKMLLELSSNGRDREVKQIINDCTEKKRWIGRYILHKLFQMYSQNGNLEIIKLLQKHCVTLNFMLYERNGEYEHYVAKAQCMKGNSEIGLSILQECYVFNIPLRSLYRMILRELIHDSVLNRSEASLVVFKRHVLEYSEKYSDHYPLICFWHICWVSTWFSDQMVAAELLDASSDLREIIKEKAPAFCLSVLRNEFNEDAVFRLLQLLLKYQMMNEYIKVLQILFAHKLKNRDLRGCTEIIRNCEALGITLSQDHQGKYVRMLIQGEPEQKENTTIAKDFKFKF